MIGYIYKITNNVNQKVYIGKTTKSIEERWKEHQQDAYRIRNEKRPLYDAIKKYGIENFSIELIEECDIAVLSNREIYWIEEYHSFSSGYNATLGGDGKILYDYDLIADLLRQNNTTSEICKILGCCPDTVIKVAKINNIPLTIINPFDLTKKSVEQYTKNGIYVQTFNSYAEAARWLQEQGVVQKNLNGVRGHIGDVCNGKRKTAYGYIWKNARLA